MALMDLADGSLKAQSESEMLCGALKVHTQRHTLYPPFFSRVDDLPDLEWNRLEFGSAERQNVPKKKGLYAFVLEVKHKNLMANSYVLYVGKAGDVGNSNTLYMRYGDYLANLRRMDRPRISEMLRRYDGYLSYYYATVADGVSTGDIEKNLLDILIPPFNTNDFTPELKGYLKGADLL